MPLKKGNKVDIKVKPFRAAVKSLTAEWPNELDKKVNKWLATKPGTVSKIDYFPYNGTVNSKPDPNVEGLQQVFTVSVSGFCALIVYYTNK